MSETKHTPGPWMVAGEDLPKCVVAEANPRLNLLAWNEGQELAECASEADANLIAAAPELLDALRDLLATMVGDEVRDEKLSVVELAARRAIEKAAARAIGKGE